MSHNLNERSKYMKFPKPTTLILVLSAISAAIEGVKLVIQSYPHRRRK